MCLTCMESFYIVIYLPAPTFVLLTMQGAGPVVGYWSIAWMFAKENTKLGSDP